jgi:hypothetical protein
VLEADSQPAFDTVQLVNGDRSVPTFSQGVGSLGSIFGAAVRKTPRETSFKKDGAFSTPQMFDMYAMSIKYDADIAFDDMVSLRFNGRWFLKIGEKTYIELPVDAFPGGPQLRVDQLAVAADAITVGDPLERNTKDVTVNEVVFNEATRTCMETGNIVPLEFPSEQQIISGFAFDNPASGVVLTANRFAEVDWLGVLKREVQ